MIPTVFILSRDTFALFRGSIPGPSKSDPLNHTKETKTNYFLSVIDLAKVIASASHFET